MATHTCPAGLLLPNPTWATALHRGPRAESDPLLTRAQGGVAKTPTPGRNPGALVQKVTCVLLASWPEGGPITRTGGQAGLAQRTAQGWCAEGKAPSPPMCLGEPEGDSNCWCTRRERGTPGRGGGGRRPEGHAALASCGRHFGPGSCSEQRMTDRKSVV